jgi:hypothetical protein
VEGGEEGSSYAATAGSRVQGKEIGQHSEYFKQKNFLHQTNLKYLAKFKEILKLL